MIKIETKLNAETAKKLNKRGLKNLSWLIIFFVGLFLLMGITDVAIGDMFGWIYIIMAVLFFPMCLLFTKLFQNMINKSSKFMSESTDEVYTFDEEFFILEQTHEGMFKNTLQANYTYLYKVIEEKENWFLYISNHQAHVLPKSGITEGSVDELNAIFKNKLGTRFHTSN